MNLVETYKRRIAVSEKVYAKNHQNAAISENLKNTVARCLANTSAFLGEAFAPSAATQRSDMGEFKKFTLDVTTCALPNLIASDLVITKPMASFTGFIQYIEFVAGDAKNGVKAGELFNNPFALGKMTQERVGYTAGGIAEEVEVGEGGICQLSWKPLYEGFKPELVGAESGASVEIVDAHAGTVKVTGASGNVKIKYVWNEIEIPQPNLPHLKARISSMTLEAKPRRIAIEYSQMAAFQAKHEMGLDLGKMLADQAVSEISYEIDTEVVTLLHESAPEDATLVFNKRKPNGISLAEHYEAFSETVAKASQIIYDRTGKHAANYMICASSILPMLGLMRGWKAIDGKRVGPYLAGSLNGLKVYVSPALAKDTFVCGFNGDDLMTSAAIFAPYMAIVPTQLLGFADGGMSQGFSTLYDVKLLNSALLVKGHIVDEPQPVEVETVNA